MNIFKINIKHNLIQHQLYTYINYFLVKQTPFDFFIKSFNIFLKKNIILILYKKNYNIFSNIKYLLYVIINFIFFKKYYFLICILYTKLFNYKLELNNLLIYKILLFYFNKNIVLYNYNLLFKIIINKFDMLNLFFYKNINFLKNFNYFLFNKQNILLNNLILNNYSILNNYKIYIKIIYKIQKYLFINILNININNFIKKEIKLLIK